MPARLPVQHKSPFEIAPRPLDEMASPHAGLLATSRASEEASQRVQRVWEVFELPTHATAFT